MELDHLINVPRVKKNMEITDIANDVTKYVTLAYADAAVRDLGAGSTIQFERRGFHQCDGIHDGQLEYIFIPDGKNKSMSALSTKVDAKEQAKGRGAK